MATLKDFLGYIINPPPGDPAATAMSDQVPSSVVTTRSAGGGTMPSADGVGGYTWIPSTGPGPTGPQGPAGATGAQGAQGPPGQGVPAGGATGQALVKSSSADYATSWVTP